MSSYRPRIYIPFSTRPQQSMGTPLAAACRIEPTMNSADAPIKVYFREYLSAGKPAQRAPTKQPALKAPLMPPCSKASGRLKKSWYLCENLLSDPSK